MSNHFENLEVWKKAHELVLSIYKTTATFPSSEKFSLVDQVRRATVSIAANIAEGNIRKHTKECIQFLYIAKASLEETKYYLLLSRDLRYITYEEYSRLVYMANHCGRLLSGLLKYFKTKV